MKNNVTASTIKRKYSQKTTLQVCLIGLLAVLGIGFASVVLEQVLVREALKGEAAHFWRSLTNDPEFSAPNTKNLKGFVSRKGESPKLLGIPEIYAHKAPGYYKLHGQSSHSLLYISEQNGQTLHLLFDGKTVLRLAIFFGVFPLLLVLMLIYLTAWWVYRESSSLLSPIVWLANKFDQFDPAHPDATLEDLSDIPGDSDWEVEKLVNSFSTYSRRIQRFVDRERTFTRDASHEFRTPLTVIKMATDIILAEQNLDDFSRKYVNRIKGSARDMEELIDAFLILARETDMEFVDEQISVADVVARETKVAQIYLEEKPVLIEIDEQYPLELLTARKVIAIVLGNLIRNAVIYTNEGKVTITIKEHSVVIEDTGIGMDEEQISKIFQPYYRAECSSNPKRKGYGVGLTIVKRLSTRFNWVVDISSEVNVGTRVEIKFHDLPPIVTQITDDVC